MLKLMGHGLRPWMEFEIDPVSGSYLKRRLKSAPMVFDGYAGFGQELKIAELGVVLCSVFVYEGEIRLRIGSAAWKLFEPGLEITHRDGVFRCELSILESSGKKTHVRYRRKDTLLLFIDSTYDDLDFELANLPARLPELAERDAAQLAQEWQARSLGVNKALRAYLGDESGGYDPIGDADDRLRRAFPADYESVRAALGKYLDEQTRFDYPSSAPSLGEAGEVFAQSLHAKYPELDAVSIRGLASRFTYGWR